MENLNPNNFFQFVKNHLIQNVQNDFKDEGIDDSTLVELKKRWEEEINTIATNPLFLREKSASRFIHQRKEYSEMANLKNEDDIGEENIEIQETTNDPKLDDDFEDEFINVTNINDEPPPQRQKISEDLEVPIIKAQSDNKENEKNEKNDESIDSIDDELSYDPMKNNIGDLGDDFFDDFSLQPVQRKKPKPKIIQKKTPSFTSPRDGGQKKMGVKNDDPKKDNDDNEDSKYSEELGSDDEYEDGTDFDEDPDDLIICRSDHIKKMTKKGWRWKLKLKNGVMRIKGIDYVFKTSGGVFPWK